MVARGISTPNILKGIHLSMAGRYAKLLRSIKVEGVIAITGGISLDAGLITALQEILDREGSTLRVITHPEAIYAGAIGAGIFAAFRERVLNQESIH
jgi:benzoyl-CoA reductase subunit D